MVVIEKPDAPTTDAPPPVPEKDAYPSVAPASDAPPAYYQLADPAAHYRAPTTHHRAPTTRAGPSHPVPAAANYATNNLELKTRKDPITGLFHIDPALEIRNPHMDELRKRRKKGKSKLLVDEARSATFETRQGDVALALAAVAPQGAQSSSARRAVIDVTTRQGNVDLGIFQIDAGRHVNLTVETRRGYIHVFIPRAFCGPVHLRSKKGKIAVLPHLARASQVVSSRDQEAMLVVGTGGEPVTKEWQGDHLSLTSYRGEIIVGYYEEDEIPKEESLWQRLGNWLSFGTKQDDDHESDDD